MTKLQIVDALALKLNIQKKIAEEMIDAFTEIIIESVLNGDKTNLSGLGVFSVKNAAERMARNPKTGEAVKVPAQKRAKFKVSRALSEKLALLPIV